MDSLYAEFKERTGETATTLDPRKENEDGKEDDDDDMIDT